jgi:4'-phosphopantetheinyl transferase
MTTSKPQVQRGTVHVWKTWIGGRPDPSIARVVLSNGELSRATAFVFDVDRNRYISCRMALRSLLGEYLELSASDVSFRYSRFGKPEVSVFDGSLDLRFNLSHCDDMALIALTVGDDVGIDIERVRQMEDIDGLAEMCFSERELAAFAAAGKDEKAQAFFNCWTRKESFVKAVGEGLSFPLKQFDVTLRPGEPAGLQALQRSADRAGSWSIREVDLHPARGWVAAVAVEATDANVEMRGWRDPTAF